MTSTLDHNLINDALKDAGSSWDAFQAHGLVSGKLAVEGRAAGPGWLAQVLEDTDRSSAAVTKCAELLVELLQMTHRDFAERMSNFSPLLPDGDDDAASRTDALAHWCEGYLHGLVSMKHDEVIAQKLAREPVAGIISDLLAVTQATIDEEQAEDADEEAYIEIVEYVRVAAQLVYEELAESRSREQQ